LAFAIVSSVVEPAAAAPRQMAFRNGSHSVLHRNGGVLYPDGSYRFPYGDAIPTVRVGLATSATFSCSPVKRSIRPSSPTPSAGRQRTASAARTRRTCSSNRRKTDSGRRSRSRRRAASTICVSRAPADGRTSTSASTIRKTTPLARALRRPLRKRRAAVERAEAAIAATYTCAKARRQVHRRRSERVSAGLGLQRRRAHTYINVPEVAGDLPQPYTLDNGTDRDRELFVR